jgi:hypothetical protein
VSFGDEHLEDILKTPTTNMVPECEKLTADKKCKHVSLIIGKHKNYGLAIIIFFINFTEGMIKVN